MGAVLVCVCGGVQQGGCNAVWMQCCVMGRVCWVVCNGSCVLGRVQWVVCDGIPNPMCMAMQCVWHPLPSNLVCKHQRAHGATVEAVGEGNKLRGGRGRGSRVVRIHTR